MLRKLASPHLNDVFQPARAQFSGHGSFGNGGAMRAAPFALAFSNQVDIRRVSDRMCGGGEWLQWLLLLAVLENQLETQQICCLKRI